MEENQEEELSPEIIAAVKEAIEPTTGVSFKVIFARYQERNPDQELTEADLVAEILEAGGYQGEEDAVFEDIVMIGSFAMGEIFD